MGSKLPPPSPPCPPHPFHLPPFPAPVTGTPSATPHKASAGPPSSPRALRALRARSSGAAAAPKRPEADAAGNADGHGPGAASLGAAGLPGCRAKKLWGDKQGTWWNMIVQIQKAGIWGSEFWRQPLQITVNHRTIHGSKWAMFNSNVLNAQRRIHLYKSREITMFHDEIPSESHQNPIFSYFSYGEIPSESHQNPICSYFSWWNPIRIPSESHFFIFFMMKSHQNPIRIPFVHIFHDEIPSESHQNPIFSSFSYGEIPWNPHEICTTFPIPRPRILQEALRLHLVPAKGHQRAQEVHQAWNPQRSGKNGGFIGRDGGFKGNKWSKRNKWWIYRKQMMDLRETNDLKETNDGFIGNKWWI